MTTFNQQGQTVGGDQHNAGGDMHISGGDTYSGNFQGAILNVRSTLTNVTQSIGTIPNATAEQQQSLEALVKQLTEALEQFAQAQPEKTEEVEAVAETTKALVEGVQKEKPNRPLLKMTGETLVKAAENLAAVTPAVLVISKQIVDFVLKLAG